MNMQLKSFIDLSSEYNISNKHLFKLKLQLLLLRKQNYGFAELKGEALDLPVNLRSYPHLWS